jgi:hypothetical protein
MAEVQVPRLPLDVARDQAVALFSRAGAMLLQILVDRYGSEETYKIIYPYFKQMGKDIAALAPQIGITGKDAIALSAITHVMEEQVIGVVGKPEEVSPDRVVKRATACSLQNYPMDVCRVFYPICDGIAEVINPDYKWYITKAIPKGDPICEFVWEKK